MAAQRRMRPLLLLLVAALAAAVPATETKKKKPHIVMLLADDLGWGNVGYHRSTPTREVATPVIDGLVKEGIELSSFYAFKYCSPTRAALQSGRNPIHVNVVNGPITCHNPNNTRTAGYSGIPLNMTTLAEKMRLAGYIPHAVGKWHVGMATLRQTPAGRGYESWLGYWSACNDYWSYVEMCGGAKCGNESMRDLWEQDRRQPPGASSLLGAPFLSQPAVALTNSQQCSQSRQDGCTFEDDRLFARVRSIITSHGAAATTVGHGAEPLPLSSSPPAPLFLFWAAHAAHGPREVPKATLDRFSFIDWQARKTYHALVAHLDGLVGELITTLKDTAMYDDTLLVFSSDNGGDDQANNYPKRGAKFSNWQGGVNVAAFVSGGFLEPERRGIKLDGLATIWDMLATFSVVGGLTETVARDDPMAAAAGLPPIDSISQWDYWSGATDAPPRVEVAIGGEVGNENGGSSGLRFSGPTASNTGVEALVMSLPGAAAGAGAGAGAAPPPQQQQQLQQLKLMVGTFHEAMWTGPQWPNETSTSFAANNSHWAVTADCRRGCLYNITAGADPNEHYDIAAEQPALVAKLMARLLEINRTVFSPDRGPPDKLGCEYGTQHYGGFWGPFLP